MPKQNLEANRSEAIGLSVITRHERRDELIDYPEAINSTRDPERNGPPQFCTERDDLELSDW